MNKLITLIVALLVIVAACALVAWLPEPCTGGVYADHPGLRAECMHNLAAGESNPYPDPGEPGISPYPAPGTVAPEPVIYPTETPEPTPTSPPCGSWERCGG